MYCPSAITLDFVVALEQMVYLDTQYPVSLFAFACPYTSSP